MRAKTIEVYWGGEWIKPQSHRAHPMPDSIYAIVRDRSGHLVEVRFKNRAYGTPSWREVPPGISPRLEAAIAAE